MAYREVATRVGALLIIAVLMVEIPGYMWKSLSENDKNEVLLRVVQKFKEDFVFCEKAKIWIVYDQDRNVYQIWMRCIDGERRC